MLEQVLARAAFTTRALRRATRLAAVARDPTVDPRVRCCWILALSGPLSPVSFLASFRWLLHSFPLSPPVLRLQKLQTHLDQCSPLSAATCPFLQKKEGLSEINARPTPDYQLSIRNWILEAESERPRDSAELRLVHIWRDQIWSRSAETHAGQRSPR